MTILRACSAQTAIALSALLVAVSGCAGGLGPRAIRAQRADYSDALQQTGDDQLLRNIVRLRYGETPGFLEVTGIVAQVQAESTVSAEVEVGSMTGATFGAAGTVSEQPTITYVPSQGEQFARRFLSPLTPEAILLLLDSGWDFGRVARLCIQRIGRLENAPRAGRPGAAHLEDAGDFTDLVSRMAPLLRDGRLRFELEQAGGAKPPGTQQVALQVADDREPAVSEVLRLLGLAKGKRHYPLAIGAQHPSLGRPAEALYVQTRSLLGILFFLGNGIEIPSQHQRAGVAFGGAEGVDPLFESSALAGDVLRIRSAEERPVAARLAARYRDWWFFVDDADLRSKATFVLLSQIHALQAAPPIAAGPTLTIPVGR